MTQYKLLTYRSNGGARAGILVNDSVHDVAELCGELGYSTVRGILEDWPRAEKVLASAADQAPAKPGLRLESLTLLAPVPQPAGIFCAGANYTDHSEEMARALNVQPEPDPRSVGLKPWHFLKPPHTVAGSGATIKLPAYSKTVDWEIELVAVIGRPAHNVSVEDALGYVAGYTIGNDLSARDSGNRAQLRDRSPFKHDWLSHKCFDGSCPLGPWITPASQIPDPQNLGMRLWVNDVLKQDSHSSRMIFSTAEQIAHLSTRLTLQPGDMILTGTPAGVGFARGEFLNPGDVTRLWIEGIGELVNSYN